MISIRSLSEEILDRICATLYPDELFPLALASKQWNRIATSHMYRHPEFSTPAYLSEIQGFLRFVFSVLGDESLAINVRSFTFQGWDDSFEISMFYEDMEEGDWDIEPFPWPASIPTEDLDRVLRAAVGKACLPTDDQEKVFQVARAGYTRDVLLGVLLSNCPNLQKLNLGYREFDDAYGHILPRRKVGLENRFQALTDVMLWGNQYRFPVDIDNFFLAVNIPSLKRLYGYNLSPIMQSKLNKYAASLQPKSSNLELLELRCSEINDVDLIPLLKTPKHLKTFIYEVGAFFSWHRLKMSGIRQALKFLEEELEELSLSHPHHPPPRDYEQPTENGINFRNFEKLRLLKVAPVFLFGTRLSPSIPILRQDASGNECNSVIARGAFAQNVPSTVETLHLLRCEFVSLEHLQLAIEGLMARKEECAPKLKRLVIEGDFQTRFWPEKCLGLNKHLIDITREKGVQLFSLWDTTTSARPCMMHDRGWGINETVEWPNVLDNEVGWKFFYRGFVRVLAQSCQRRKLKWEARESERRMQRREEEGSQYESDEDKEGDDEYSSGEEDDDKDSFNEEYLDEESLDEEDEEVENEIKEFFRLAEEGEPIYQVI